MANPRKETSAQARKAALESDLAPLYALAGLTDLFAETLRATITQSQERTAKRVADLQGKRPEFEALLRHQADELNKLLRSLPEQVKSLPESSRSRIADFTEQAQALVSQAEGAYGEFVGRGRRAVDDAIASAQSLSAVVEKRAEDVVSDVVDDVADLADRAEAVLKAPAKKAPAKKAPAKKVAADGVAAAPVPAKKAPAKKAPAQKAPAKKAPARKAPAKKAPAQKAAASADSAS